MNHKNDIQNELRELNSSLSHERKRPFNVPDGYFENFAGSVLVRIKQEQSFTAFQELESLSSLLSTIPQTMPFNVPEDYFSSLNSDLTALIKEVELPVELIQLQKTVPYDVPINYFELLPGQIIAKVTGTEKKAKVISIRRTNWLRYAAAAVIVGIIAISSIFYFKEEKPHYIAFTDIAGLLRDISNQELEEFINITETSIKGNKKVPSPVAEVEVRTLLNDVSNNELNEFLYQIPIDTDENLINNNEELPANDMEQPAEDSEITVPLTDSGERSGTH